MAQVANAHTCNIREVAVTPSKPFPIPGFIASSSWSNAWRAGKNRAATVALDEFGTLTITKVDASTFNLVLNAEGKDLKRLTLGNGHPLQDNRAFIIQLDAVCTESINAQLVINEYDANGERLTRSLLKNRAKGIFVANEMSEHVVIALRTVGVGNLAINKIEVSENTEVPNATPGLHQFASLTSSSDNNTRDFAEMKKFLLSNRFLRDGVVKATADRVAETIAEARRDPLISGGHHEQLLNEIHELRQAVRGLQYNFVTEELRTRLTGVDSVRFGSREVTQPASPTAY